MVDGVGGDQLVTADAVTGELRVVYVDQLKLVRDVLVGSLKTIASRSRVQLTVGLPPLRAAQVCGDPSRPRRAATAAGSSP
jgi:hypothetical protein